MAVLQLATWRQRNRPTVATLASFAPGQPRVVPLFESADALESCGEVLEQLLANPDYRHHLESRATVRKSCSATPTRTRSRASSRQCGCSTGPIALADVARRNGIELTSSTVEAAPSAGGGPTNRAILRRPALDRRPLQDDEQGETVAANYSNPPRRAHLSWLPARRSSRRLPSTTTAWPRWTAAQGAHGRAGRRARDAYRSLVYDEPGFPEFFRPRRP